MIVDVAEAGTPVDEAVDAVIVGSGAGGAPLAATLAEAGLSVVLLEEGAHFTRLDFNRRVGDMFRRLYRDGGQTSTLGFPAIPLPLGKTLGGTTTVNSGTMFRVPDKVLLDWAREHGLEGTGPDDMAPFFEQVERDVHVQPVRPHQWGTNADVVRRGAEALGLSHGPLLRNVSDACKGSGVCCFGCPEDGKQPMHLTYLPRADRAGARIYTRVRVERVRTEGGRAVGVEGRAVGGDRGRGRVAVRVRARAVVLSAGTVYTPVLLATNGLEGGSRQAGRNLTIHPASRVAAVMDEEVDGWRGVPQGYMIDSHKDEGIMFEGAQGPPELMGPALPGVGPELKQRVSELRHLAVFGAMVSDKSTGRVRVVRGRPVMTYQINREDTRKMLKAIAILCDVFLAAGARRVLPAIAGAGELARRSQIADLQRARVSAAKIEMMAFHPLGTCRMGADRAHAVVDGWLQSHEVRDLWVVDGSVFPSSLGVNPQETIMAFALRTGRHLADRLAG